MSPNELIDFDHYMVDMETLGLGPQAKILSIGVVHFNPVAPTEAQSFQRCFYAELATVAQPVRDVDQSTLDWWNTQPEGLMPQGSEEPGIALLKLERFLKTTKHPMLWAQGTDFDITKLESFYSQYFSARFPWKYNSKRDLRTLVSLCPRIEWPENLMKHNALEDAKCQALMVWRCVNHISYSRRDL